MTEAMRDTPLFDQHATGAELPNQQYWSATLQITSDDLHKNPHVHNSAGAVAADVQKFLGLRRRRR